MSRRAFVVAGIVECLQPGRGGWELIDSHGAGIELSVPLHQVEE